MPMDMRAKKILFSTFWSATGWIHEELRATDPADLAYAKARRFMFDPITIDHDELVARTVKIVGSLGIERVSGVFLASLSSRRLDWRSGLASYVLSAGLAPHAFSTAAEYDECEVDLECDVCKARAQYRDEDLDILSFQRHKWGGTIGRAKPLYRLHDLTELAHDLPGAPLPDDLEIFERLLGAIDKAPHGETPTKLSKRLADTLPSSKSERDSLLEILAASGVLVAKERRRGPDTDWMYVEDWRGEDGYDRAAVTKLFGMHRKPKRR